MAEWHHDGQEGLYEDFLYVVDIECLERTRSLGKDGPCGVCRFEVFSNCIGVRKDLGSGGISRRIYDYGKGVYGATIASNSTRWGTH